MPHPLTFLKKSFLILSLLMAAIFISATPTQAFITAVDDVTGAEYVSGEILVKYNNWQNRNTSLLVQEGGVVKEEDANQQIVVYQFPDWQIPIIRKDASELDPNIAYAEPNFVYKSTLVAQDSLFANNQKVMWNGTTRYEPQYAMDIQEDMRFDHAWDTTTGSEVTAIAVLDSGINVNHQDLVGKVAQSYNFINPGQSSIDDNGHGTAVASVIAANTNFSTATAGMAGACPNCTLLDAKVLKADKTGTMYGVAKAMYWAKDQGVEVINLSLGASGDPSQAFQDALMYVRSGNNNVTVVASAGNSGDERLFYPGAHPLVIGVGSIEANGTRSNFSTYGSWVDVMAYGRNILVAKHSDNTGYTNMYGTSFSAPFVSGAVALMYNRSDLPSTNRADYISKTIIERARISTATSLSNRVLDAQAVLTQPLVAETQTTKTVKFYYYQDNDNNDQLSIGDVCMYKPLSLQKRDYSTSPPQQVSLPQIVFTPSSPQVITTISELNDCWIHNSVGRDLEIGQLYTAKDPSDDPTSFYGYATFLPEYGSGYQYESLEHELFGDCNGNGGLDAGDFTAIVLEINDGDGSNRLDTLGGTFKGNRFCDANQDTVIDAGDISCLNLRIFNINQLCGWPHVP